MRFAKLRGGRPQQGRQSRVRRRGCGADGGRRHQRSSKRGMNKTQLVQIPNVHDDARWLNSNTHARLRSFIGRLDQRARGGPNRHAIRGAPPGNRHSRKPMKSPTRGIAKAKRSDVTPRNRQKNYAAARRGSPPSPPPAPRAPPASRKIRALFANPTLEAPTP